jgi:REP element-mobilizing transposase RayT
MPARVNFPLAYHITWGTYGIRLHGDERGTVDRSMNNFGDPIIGRDGDWQRIESSLLRFPVRVLTIEQRVFVEDVIPEICGRGGWKFITTAAAPDHVHNIISASVDGKDVRKWLKRWLSEALSQRWPVEQGQVRWAECGSVKWIWNDDYYRRAEDYIRGQRTHSE